MATATATATATPRHSLSVLATIPITESIPLDSLAWALKNPPFVALPGAINFRALGPVASNGAQLKPGVVYRSGNLSRITGEGKARLRELGVERIFDLRVEREVKGSAAPSIEGVEVVWVKDQGMGATKPNPADFAVDEAKAYINMYTDVLSSYRPAYKSVLSHILDKPGVPFVFHCTAGKDRTGVLGALLLSLVGFSSDEIAADYVLTRIGLEPGREMLLMIMERDQGYDLAAPGMMGLISTKYENMIAFLEVLETNYGGAEGYVKTELGFSEEQVERIRESLLVP